MSLLNSKSGPAPWREQFLSHLSKMTSPEFTFSTLAHSSDGNPIPRARTCIFRGLWCCVPEDVRNAAERNPGAYESDMPMFSTDVRMEKTAEVIRSAPSANHDNIDVYASDGGGPVEAVWWVKEQNVMTQWRVRGDAWILGPDIGENNKEGSVRVKQALSTRMRCLDEVARDDWSWDREVGVVFGAQSPSIKGSFRSPPPGMPVGDKPDGYEVGLKLEDLDDPIARQNFRVVVIRPSEVEATDLSNPKLARRHRYTYEINGNWSLQELWP